MIPIIPYKLFYPDPRFVLQNYLFFIVKLMTTHINNLLIVQTEQVARDLGNETVHSLMTAPCPQGKSSDISTDCSVVVVVHLQYKCQESFRKKGEDILHMLSGRGLCYNCFPNHTRRAKVEDKN